LTAWTTSPLVVGHRGGRGEGWPPENTMAAFSRALAEGATAIELDVRTCASGNVVVFHDASLRRMTADRDCRSIERVPIEDLRRVDIGGARVPELADVLAWAREGEVAVNVEMKHDVVSRAGLARETLRVVKLAAADVLLSSFDPLLLAMAAALAPSVPRALLVHDGQALAADLLQEVARPPLVRALHVERTQARPAAVARYARRGLRIGAWTVNDPRDARDLVGLGVASIITDAPGQILAALSRK
jgi:glycerophosphoryl diester phosphodiesterase